MYLLAHLAWLGFTKKVVMPSTALVSCLFPGTGNPKHMEENAKAVALSYTLSDEDMEAIETCVPRKAMENLPRYGGGLGERVFTKENNISLEEWKN